MNGEDDTMICTHAIETFHRLLDGELMDVAERQAMETHAKACSECRETMDGLRFVHDELRGLAELPLPDETLDAVWQRTVRTAPAETAARRFDWRFAAAAATIALAVWAGIASFPNKGGGETAEAELAAQQLRLVLGYTAAAMQRTEEAAFGDVLANSVTPALRRVGVRWGASTAPAAPTGGATQDDDPPREEHQL